MLSLPPPHVAMRSHTTTVSNFELRYTLASIKTEGQSIVVNVQRLLLWTYIRLKEDEMRQRKQAHNFTQEMSINAKMVPTLLFSVATVALMLFADRRTIFSLVNPKNVARG